MLKKILKWFENLFEDQNRVNHLLVANYEHKIAVLQQQLQKAYKANQYLLNQQQLLYDELNRLDYELQWVNDTVEEYGFKNFNGTYYVDKDVDDEDLN